MTALVIGATGLVGRALVELLLHEPRFTKVKVFARRSTGLVHEKLQEHRIEFDQPDTWRHQVTGDVLFSTLGTTLRQAGGKDAQYVVDYTYQYRFATIAAGQGVRTYVLVSSAGADPRSRIFYSRMKGELERDVRQLPFTSIRLIRPGILAGHRSETRIGERIGIALASAAGLLPFLRQYRPIPAATVARALIQAALGVGGGVKVYELESVFRLAEGKA